MGDLKRQKVARVVQQHLPVKLGRPVEIAVQPGTGGGGVAAFAIVGGGGQRLGGLDAAAQFRLGALLGRHQHQPGAHAVAHHEGGIFFKRFVDHGQRIGEEAAQQGGSMFEAVERMAVRRGDGFAVHIVQAHGAVTPGEGLSYEIRLPAPCQRSVIGGVNGS